MALGKSPVMDARRSSSSWSTLTPVMFVALCLLGIWTITSTTVVPGDVSSENKLEMRQQIAEIDSGQYKDGSGDAPDGSSSITDGNINTNDLTTETKFESSDEQNVLDKTDGNIEKAEDGYRSKDSVEDKNDIKSKQTPYSDENGSSEEGEIIKEGSETKEGTQEDSKDTSPEETSQDTIDSDQEKKAAQQAHSDENGITEGGEMVKEIEEIKENVEDKSTENNSNETEENKQEKITAQQSDEATDNAQYESSEHNSDGKTEGGDMVKEVEEIKENVEDKSTENNSNETEENKQEKITAQQSDEATDNAQYESSEQNSDGTTEGGEMVKEVEEIKENVEDKSTENNSNETEENKQEKITAQQSDEATDNAQYESSEQNSDGTTEGGEMVKEVEEIKENVEDKSTENNSHENEENEQEKIAEQQSDEATDNAQSSEQNSEVATDGNVTEDGEMIKGGSDTKETTDSEQEKETNEKFNEPSDDEQYSNSENILNETKGYEQTEQMFNETIDNWEKKSSEKNNNGEQNSNEISTVNKVKDQASDEVFPNGALSELLNENSTQNGAWSTQAAESKNEKEVQAASAVRKGKYNWKLCNVTAGADYIPCLDNEDAIKNLRSTKHYEHRERHCPDEAPTCLVTLPDGYKKSIEWPNSRNKIWYYNVPHAMLATVKERQNWVKVSGEYLTFPGGGTQFKHGALYYVDLIQESVPDIAWGTKSRVVLDVGCGVASFGGYLFDRDVLTMSFAPKDEHEAQVQLALERGIPAISAVMGTERLPFPGMVFDVIHCARCRVPWHIEGGILLLELNRLLRPGGYFVWSATPTYQKRPQDVEIWKAMLSLTKSMCWDMVNKTKDRLNRVGMAIYKKPSDNECYEKRMENSPPICQGSDDPNAAWNISLQACLHKLPIDPSVRGSQWPQQWPRRLKKTPYWLNSSQVEVYGKPAPEDFKADLEHWRLVISNTYLKRMGITWSTMRNIMDMRAVYGGFAAALQEVGEVNAWVMNIASIDSPDTLPVIYERGLFGIYHDWCQSFSTYPRSYDLLHADHLFSRIKKRCKLLPVIVEVDRILRPEGNFIVRDNSETVEEVESIVKSLKYEVRLTYSQKNVGLLCVQKTMWRPKEVEAS